MPFWFPSDDTLDILILREVKEIDRTVEVINFKQDIILAELRDLRAIFQPRLTSLLIRFDGGLMPASIEVGKMTVASVQGFDQFGNPFPIDLSVNPPAWSIDNPAVATINPDGSVPTSEDVLGVAAGTANLSVSCAGLSTSDVVTVTAPTPVLTRLGINFVNQ